jgi:hypothetical protein
MKTDPRNKSRVYWTEPERRQIVDRAADVQRIRPDLAGLPLLRVAIQSLPLDRRRDIVALSQASWFEEAIVAESKRREARIKEQKSDPAIPIMRQTAEEIQAHRLMMTRYSDNVDIYMSEDLSLANQAVAMLVLIHREMCDLNESLRRLVRSTGDHPDAYNANRRSFEAGAGEHGRKQGQ